jgi:hypothetical protein
MSTPANPVLLGGAYGVWRPEPTLTLIGICRSLLDYLDPNPQCIVYNPFIRCGYLRLSIRRYSYG